MQSRTKLQKLLIGNVQSNFKNQIIWLLSPPPPLNDTFFATSLGSYDYKTLFFCKYNNCYSCNSISSRSRWYTKQISFLVNHFQSKCFVSSF
jgi:hypothetical protein